MHLPGTRPVAGEDDTVIAAINRADIVESAGLVGYFADDGGVALPETSHFVELPDIGFHLVAFARRSHHCAKNDLAGVPTGGWIPHGDRTGTLHAHRA